VADIEGREIELEEKQLFNNQWNTAPVAAKTEQGLRVFDWAKDYPLPNGCPSHIARGHYLEQTVEMQEARKRRHACGYCGYQTDEPAEFCNKCLGSKYLEEKEMYLLRMLPVDSRQERKPGNLPADLIERFRQLRTEYASKQGERLAAEKVKFLAAQVEKHAKIDRQTAIYSELYDRGIDHSKTGAVYYNHADSLQFGAIASLTDEQRADIRQRMEGFTLCAWGIK
jgi:hypothetical protein